MYFVRDLVSPRTWLAFIHHFLGVCVGAVAVWIVVPGLVAGSLGLPVAMIGMPIIGSTLRFTDWFARAERARFAVTLGEQIPGWPAGTRSGYRMRLLPRLAKLSERATWREVGYAVARGPLSAAAAFVTLGVWAVGLIMVTLPLFDWSLPGGGAHVDGRTLHEPKAVLAAVAGLLVLLAAPQVTKGLAVADAALARRLLGPPSSLAARVAELELSRERVADAAETERKRIERDLHDGAQQHLVALRIALRLAREAVRESPDEAAELLAQTEKTASDALAELRDLAHGIYPPLLADHGLPAALEAHARKAGLPVVVDAEGTGRYPRQAEAAVYFAIGEALQNVAKYAQASAIRVTVRQDCGWLAFRVDDDGTGFDQAATPMGSGIQGMADRMAALGGTLEISSVPGQGTTVTGRIPVPGSHGAQAGLADRARC
jgi:signal transduction histidine kinase